jgi:cytochrome P450
MGGALDTTAVTTHNLILSLAAHQDAQAKVQEEVDRVVGRSRLPNKEDLPKLHYCRAFVAESQRFSSEALPEQVKNAGGLVSSSPRPGVPHRLEQDDVYEGYLLPKGSTVIANAWTMSFDPDYFPDPHAFKPERYLAKDGTYDSSVLVVDFGFGRRFVG